MLSYDIYRYIFIGGLVLSIVMLLAAVAVFFLFNIKNVIGDLTGSNERKAVENIRSQSLEASRELRKKKAAVRTHRTGGLTQQTPAVSEEIGVTDKISTQDRYDNLGNEETTALNVSSGSEETTTLNVTRASETTALGNAPVAILTPFQTIRETSPDFVVEADITYVHAGEVIR